MQLIQKVVRDIIKEVAAERNISTDLATEIVMSQFKFVAVEIAKGRDCDPSTFSNILLKYFGTFSVSEGRLKVLKRNKEKKLEQQLIENNGTAE